MDNYALYLLQNALRDERLHRFSAEQYFKEHYPAIGRFVEKPDYKAFDESKKLADKRIPELIDAIEKIKNDGLQTGN